MAPKKLTLGELQQLVIGVNGTNGLKGDVQKLDERMDQMGMQLAVIEAQLKDKLQSAAKGAVLEALKEAGVAKAADNRSPLQKGLAAFGKGFLPVLIAFGLFVVAALIFTDKITGEQLVQIFQALKGGAE